MFISRLAENSAQESHGCETEEETKVSVSCLSHRSLVVNSCDIGRPKHRTSLKINRKSPQIC